MTAVARGDGHAMAELLRRHGDYLYGVARTLTNSPADAEDAVQETLAALLTAKYRGDASARTFLVSIVVRQAALIRRRTKPVMRLVDDSAPPDEANEQLAVDARLDLASLLEKLSPEHREVLVLRELQGQGYEEMAKTLGVPRGTIESRLYRAREQLKQLWTAKH
ncbi:MAG: RNA polymerase sigma factor [Tepidisphaeraceae bacterium]